MRAVNNAVPTAIVWSHLAVEVMPVCGMELPMQSDLLASQP